ncbi:hypothetical protein [Aquibium sp. ELW1220]|uniref:hypothetical protein n=1 Tax=Aquibium sp. ELW1220 TaxID=2976766 RepID=UPI0025B0628B|nr:hypothetical protein [Aquibium sp. ELW1220]MDN2578841.1 hypothetical protein [Aquibium sp. ELW1220]
MSWREEVLEDILALLVLFAGLADRAASRPLAIALPVLAGLAHAESVARNYLIGLPAGAPALLATSRSGDRAARLAADFRMLARMLRAYLALARRRARFATCDIARQASSLQQSGVPGSASGCRAMTPRASDTS